MERIKSQFSDSNIAIANEPNSFNRSEAERRAKEALPPEIDVQSMTFREHEDAYEKNLLEK